MTNYGGKTRRGKEFADTCIVCFGYTDSALAFRGEAEWVVAGLMKLGVPEDQAVATFTLVTGCDPGNVPVGITTQVIRVCAECAEQAGLPHPTVIMAGGPVPLIDQPDHLRSE